MASIIEELQRDVLNGNTSLSDLLRKSRTIAVKLNLQQPTEWVESELNGYKADVPEYRVVFGSAKFNNPYHGWLPLMFGDAKTEQQICRRPLPNSIAELEHFVSHDQGIAWPLPGDLAQRLCRGADMPTMQIHVFFPKNIIVGILDTVRTRILDWSLALEQAGIKGEGLSFSPAEKAMAHNPNVTYQIGSIGNFSGNLGGTVGGDININSLKTSEDGLAKAVDLIKQIRTYNEQMGLAVASQDEMRSHVDKLEIELGKPEPNAGKISGLLKSIKAIAEGAAGNVIASGISALAGQLLQNL